MFSVGLYATGFVAIGLVSSGVFSFGVFSFGVFSSGAIVFGLFTAGLLSRGVIRRVGRNRIFRFALFRMKVQSPADLRLMLFCRLCLLRPITARFVSFLPHRLVCSGCAGADEQRPILDAARRGRCSNRDCADCGRPAGGSLELRPGVVYTSSRGLYLMRSRCQAQRFGLFCF